MTVAEVLVNDRGMWDEPVTVHGHLVVTSLFSYLARGADDARGVIVDEPRLADRLLGCAPLMVGSLVLFSGTATVEGLLQQPTGLPMFPALLHSVSALVFCQDGRDPVRLEFSSPTAPGSATRDG